MGESYNSTFTGAQIDEAIQKVRDGVVQLSAQTLTDEQKTQARTNIGAVKSWRELTGKPVVTEPSDTLTWDGNTDGLVSDNTGGWYKISEVVPAISDLANGAIVNKKALGADAFVDTGAGVVLHGDGAWIVFVSSDGVNVDIDGLIFPEAGTYFYEYIRTLTIPGYTGFGQEKIAPSHLYQPDWEQTDETAPDFVKNKPFGDVHDAVIWDGNKVGKLTVEGLYIKVSDSVPTMDDLANGFEIRGIVGGAEFSQAFGADAVQDDGSALNLADELIIIVNQVDDSSVFTETGVYFIDFSFVATPGDYLSRFTIPGYTGFDSAKKIDKKYVPFPGAILLYADSENYLYANSDTSDTAKRITLDQFKEIINSYRTLWLAVVGTDAAAYETLCFVGYANGAGRAMSWSGDAYYTAEYTAEETTT